VEIRFKLQKRPSKRQLFITVALSLVIIVSTALLLWPYVYKLKPISKKLEYTVSEETKSKLFKTEISNSIIYTPKETLPRDNMLLIPGIDVEALIHEAPTLDILDRNEGVWREPSTDNPEKGGNMVLAGHRFQYLPPNTNTFYNLNKLMLGEKILVVWNQKEYVYEITKTHIVTPDKVNILEDDKSIPNKLTLYTCTPLGSNTKRLVIESKLI
jgi:LPXTG-site transpeptidase (sortase) family protein